MTEKKMTRKQAPWKGKLNFAREIVSDLQNHVSEDIQGDHLAALWGTINELEALIERVERRARIELAEGLLRELGEYGYNPGLTKQILKEIIKDQKNKLTTASDE